MKNLDHVLWTACNEASDYFSKLGGSGRYAGFQEYHIPALVLITALLQIDDKDQKDKLLKQLLPDEMWNSTDDLTEKVAQIIANTEIQSAQELRGLVKHFEKKYQEKDAAELKLWEVFLGKLETEGWNF